MMHNFSVRTVVAVTLMSLLAGCQSAESYRQAQRADLDQRYPAGSVRKDIHAKHGEPRRAVVLAEAPDAIDVRAQEMLNNMPPETKDLVERYEVYWVSWAHPAHSSISSRTYADYVFYGNQDHVISKYRVFVD